MLRMSTLFLRTLRDDPADAEVPSHRLLVRAGYIRRAAPGGFTWLPLGWIVYRNVERIVREEMDAAGFQEVHFPALLPREPYDATGRWTDYGDNMFRLQDRRGNDFLLAPTHEEMFTLLVKDLYASYKDLPLVIYQIQTKYRDEARPRAGLLRGREFVMKDSYSFDVDDAGLDVLVPAPPRRLHQDVRPPRPAVRDRVGDVGGDGRLGQRGVPRPARRRRGHVRAHGVGQLRRQRRGGPRRRSPTRCRSTTPRRPSPTTRRARRRSPRSSTTSTGATTCASPTGEWTAGRHAEERHRHAAPPRRHDASRWPSGVPGDRDVDLKRLEAQVASGRARAVHRRGLRPLPGAGQGLHRAGRARGVQRHRHPLPRRPAGRHRHALGHRRRRDRPPRRRARRRTRLHARRRDRRRRRARRRPRPATASRWSWPAASRSATSSSSAGSTPRPWASPCSARRASRSW